MQSSSPWVTIPNLAYERAATLFNLAALYSQLARAEDRSHAEGIKRANAFYQVGIAALCPIFNQSVRLTP